MKSITVNILVCCSLAGLLAGCNKDERLTYEEDPRVYFFKRAGAAAADSVDVTFATMPVTVEADTVYLSLRIMGSAADKDRSVNIVKESGTAKEGYHYAIGETIIPANAFEAQVPVYLFKRPGLKDSTVHVVFAIRESEDFKPGYFDNPAASHKYDRLHYKVSVTDQLVKPSLWDGVWLGLFGTYSEVKFRFLIEATGRTNWNSYPFPQDQRFLAQRAKLALIEYRQQNGPLYDEFGEEVTFP